MIEIKVSESDQIYIENAGWKATVPPFIRYGPLTPVTKLLFTELECMLSHPDSGIFWVSDQYLMKMLNLQPVQIKNAYKQLTTFSVLKFQKVLIHGMIYRQIVFNNPNTNPYVPIVLVEEEN